MSKKDSARKEIYNYGCSMLHFKRTIQALAKLLACWCKFENAPNSYGEILWDMNVIVLK